MKEFLWRNNEQYQWYKFTVWCQATLFQAQPTFWRTPSFCGTSGKRLLQLRKKKFCATVLVSEIPLHSYAYPSHFQGHLGKIKRTHQEGQGGPEAATAQAY